MTTLNRGDIETIFLPEQQTLTAIAATNGAAVVSRLGDSAGAEPFGGPVQVASGTTVVIGPFADGTRHAVQCLSGSVSYTMARVLGGGGGGGGSGRTVLLADTTFYVATTGNDSTGDGTVGNPWATIQHSVDHVVNLLDCNSYQVTIQIADGIYPEFVICGVGINSGNNSIEIENVPFILQGNVSDNTAVKISPIGGLPSSGDLGGVINITDEGKWWYRFLSVSASGVTDSCDDFSLFGNAVNVLIESCDFGNCGAGGGSFVSAGNFCHVFGSNTTSATSVGSIFKVGYMGMLFFDGTLQFKHNLAISDVGFYATGSSWMVIASDQLIVDPGVTITGNKVEIETGSLITDSGFINTNVRLTKLPGDGTIIVDHASWFTGMQGAFSQAGIPTIADLAPGTHQVFKDTSGGGVYLAYNDAGTIKKVSLT
ncbi:MAG: hypothetical protein JWP25_8936 [Bradyrhizobium sp.]|nr:hypothetical protein [Bradyrhizobium sp.]